ncbi:hypothetical protein [Chitinophaga cymbidii]|uniref:DNA-binding protein n=1 Tax=Chitinophaga cymbidii TaxID=1096750 RepID=A0A512RPZ0_9BACT|nr:hypothetical protein [Chitinophaga cymbidii]GEP97762.1 hypothetical protein CCY01nite_40220 [Chitinophaga cymbidii]
MKRDEIAVMKAVALCYKPFLKPAEAMIYCNLEHTQLAKKLQEYGIYKSVSGYYKREDLDLMMSGGHSRIQQAVQKMKL